MEKLFCQLKEVSKQLKRNNLNEEARLLDSYLKQYCYRYLLQFILFDENSLKWKKRIDDGLSQLNYIEQVLYDGSYDKQHNDVLLHYHNAGVPRKLCVKWYVSSFEYSAYFWFEDAEFRHAFDTFYGAHPETKTDFIIRIDAEKNKYELALYRYGIEKPRVIPERCYQLLVFKNKFECYRSDNYNQERGAWIW